MASNDELKAEAEAIGNYDMTLEFESFFHYDANMARVIAHAYWRAQQAQEPIEIWLNERSSELRQHLATVHPDGKAEDMSNQFNPIPLKLKKGLDEWGERKKNDEQ